MKKPCKIILSVSIIIILVVIIAIGAYGFGSIYIANNWSPMRQPNTEWVSEDGRVTFVTRDDGNIRGTEIINGEAIPVITNNIYTTGTVTIDGKSTDVNISQFVSGNTIWVVPTDAEAITTGQYDSWKGYFISKKKFIAIVEYDGLFFKEGEKITFYRQD